MEDQAIAGALMSVFGTVGLSNAGSASRRRGPHADRVLAEDSGFRAQFEVKHCHSWRDGHGSAAGWV